MTIEEKITALINDNRVMIFSKTYCPFCKEAKQLFTSLNIAFTSYELDTESDGAEIQESLHTRTGQRTVPNVFVAGKHVGGCDDVKKLSKEGKLKEMVGC